jgi:diguanylate cyclase (GGDEF)-like protein
MLASSRAGWTWIAAGTLSGVAGSVLWTVPMSLPSLHGLAVQDLCWLSVYPLTLRGVVLRVRTHRLTVGVRRAMLLDTVVVTSAATVIAWHLLISPLLNHGISGRLDAAVSTVVATIYPLGDVAMFALAAALLFAPTRRGTPETLLVSALALELPLDLVNAVITAHAPEAAGGWYRAGYLAINGMITAAVLHPRTAVVATGGPDPRSMLNGWRILLLGAGLSGVSLSTLFLAEVGLRRVPVAIALVAALCAVLLRFQRLVRALESAEQTLHYQVAHDQLTGAASRTRLFDELAIAVPQSIPALIFVDLDGFKLINDTLGHQAGDGVLLAVAQRLASVVRRGDLVARMGGDEFVVLCHDVDEHEAEALGRRIADAVRQPLTLDGRSVSVGASVGILVAETRPRAVDDTVDHTASDDLVRELIAAADAAMYDAKRNGAGVRVARLSLTP